MIDVLSYLPSKRKATSSGWVSFNAVCCSNNGETQDKRGRGGIRVHEEDWSYHCFNCGYTASFTVGRPVSFKARRLLEWLGVDSVDIERLNLESLKRKSMLDLARDRQQIKRTEIEFEEREIPKGLELLDKDNPQHQSYVEYIERRGIRLQYPLLVAKQKETRDRIVVPFTYKDRIVGHTSRYLDDRMPKFINDQQPGYVFGYDLQKPNWTSAIVTEGIFDALSIGGMAVMHDTISKAQIQLLKQLHRRIIVVPDQDKTGINIVDVALENGFEVSIPDWPDNVKDVNDSVQMYGVVNTLLQIHEFAEKSRIKIEMARKKLQRKING
jgi:nitrogen fixation protein